MKTAPSRLVSALAAGALAATMLAVTAAPAHAAAATVGNGITTRDLSVVGTTPTSLAQELAGPGVVVSNVSYSGAAMQAGTVDLLDPAVVSFNHGVILSSGSIADVMGPNSSDGITTDVGGGGDAGLTALIAASQTVDPNTYDAASLSFDFVPNASQVYFTYTFASDEFLEWVNLFNDVFGFFVNGTNCAVTPDGDPVSIDTINSGANTGLFRDNSFSNPPANPINVESDGLSVELVCSAAVTPGAVNHLKLAIADTSDHILDSVVMIKAGSLSTQKPESCNDSMDNDDDLLVDMDDPSCTATTTPAPTGSAGTGSAFQAPPFTGTEGSPVVLDASALGWTPATGTVTTTWTVTGINGTAGTCVVSPAGPVKVNADGSAAVVTAVCPADGEYVARIDGWDAEGGGSWDTDVDFFVHNAAPAVSIDSPFLGAQVAAGDVVTLSAPVGDPGGDPVTCEVAWGDGTTTAVSPDADGFCTADHTWSADGDLPVTVTATDDAGDSSAALTVVTVTGASLAPQTITASAPASATYGGTFAVTASGGASGSPLVYAASGGCTASGSTYTMTSGVTDCVVRVDQAAGNGYDAAATWTATVAAAKRAITVTAASPTKVVGTADPALTWSVTSGSLVPGTALAGAVTRTAGETVGTYAVAAGSLAAPVDYALTYVPGVLTIVPAPPTVTKLSPTTGGVGTSITITGTKLTGATSVTVNGIAARFTVLSDTSLVTSVPVGATTGKITVTTAGGTASSASFTVGTTKKAPTVTSFTPTSGAVGTTVTLTGTNLAGATSVKLGTVTVASGWTVLSATQLRLAVPAGAATGTVAVTTDGGTGTSTASYTVPVPLLATKLVYTGPTSAAKSAKLSLTAQLAAGTTPVSGASVSFVVAGKTYKATTSATGVVTVAVTAPATAGSYAVTLSYAGSTKYAASSASATLTVK